MSDVGLDNLLPKTSTMDKHLWRSRARLMGIVDVVLVVADGLLLIAIMVGLLVWGPIEVYNFFCMLDNDPEIIENVTPRPDDIHGNRKMTFIEVSQWISLAPAILCWLLEVIAVRKLLLACRMDCEVNQAIKNARFWEIVKVVSLIFYIFTIIDIMQTGLSPLRCYPVVRIICHVVGIIVVQKYIYELDSFAVSRDSEARRCDGNTHILPSQVEMQRIPDVCMRDYRSDVGTLDKNMQQYYYNPGQSSNRHDYV